jgi:hypothetical protein
VAPVVALDNQVSVDAGVPNEDCGSTEWQTILPAFLRGSGYEVKIGKVRAYIEPIFGRSPDLHRRQLRIVGVLYEYAQHLLGRDLWRKPRKSYSRRPPYLFRLREFCWYGALRGWPAGVAI